MECKRQFSTAETSRYRQLRRIILTTPRHASPPSSATGDAPLASRTHTRKFDGDPGLGVGACYSGSGTRTKLIPCHKTEVDFNDRRKVTYVRPYPDRKLGRTLRGSRSGRIRSAFLRLHPSVCLPRAKNRAETHSLRADSDSIRFTSFVRKARRLLFAVIGERAILILNSFRVQADVHGARTRFPRKLTELNPMTLKIQTVRARLRMTVIVRINTNEYRHFFLQP